MFPYHMIYALSLKHCEIHIYCNELFVSTVLVSIIFNTQFMRNSCIVYAIKIHSVSKNEEKSLQAQIPAQEKTSCKIPPEENPSQQNASTLKNLPAKHL